MPCCMISQCSVLFLKFNRLKLSYLLHAKIFAQDLPFRLGGWMLITMWRVCLDMYGHSLAVNLGVK